MPLYPCLYMYGNGYRISPDEVIRGNAANLWRNGADGIYLFNWFAYGPWRKHLFREISDSTLLRRKDKLYTLTQHFDSAPFLVNTDAIRYNTALRDAALPVFLPTGDEHTLEVPIGEALEQSQSAELWIGLHHTQPGDRLDLHWHGKVLRRRLDVTQQMQRAGFRLEVPADNGLLGFREQQRYDMHFPALRLPLDASRLQAGRNQLHIGLSVRGSGSNKPLRISRVELLTRS